MASLFDGFETRTAVMSFIDPISKKETSFTLDVTTNINTKLSAAVTKFPVEGRKNITDHVQPAPLSLSVQCFISESPSNPLRVIAGALLGAAVGQVAPGGMTTTFLQAYAAASVAGAGSGYGKPTGRYKEANFAPLLTERDNDEQNFPKRAMLGLTKMFQAGTKFSLHTFFTKDLYKDMVMTSLNFTQTPEVGDSLSFSMNCEQITTTEAFTGEAGADLKAVDPAGGSQADSTTQGKKTALEDPKAGPKRSSKIMNIVDGVSEAATGLFGG